MKIILLWLLSSQAFAFDTLDQKTLDRFKEGTFSLYEVSPGYDEVIEHDVLKNKKDAAQAKADAGVNLTLRSVPFAPADSDAEKVIQVKSCEDTVAEIRKLKAPAEIPNGAYPLLLGFLELRTSAQLVFDFAKDRFCNGLGDLNSQYYTDTYGFSVSVISALGPLVTTSGYVSAVKSGAPKTYEGEWKSFNLATKQDAVLSDFFEVDSVLRTLKTSPFMAQQKYFAKLQKDKKLYLALKRISAEGFSVSAIDEKKSLAKLHIALKNIECDTCVNQVKQIALWVKPKPAFMAQLKDVKNKKQGFFLGLKSEKNLNHFQRN